MPSGGGESGERRAEKEEKREEAKPLAKIIRTLILLGLSLGISSLSRTSSHAIAVLIHFRVLVRSAINPRHSWPYP